MSKAGEGPRARTDGAAEIRVVLASATTVDKLCAPVDTKGVLPCGHDGMAALHFTAWAAGLSASGADRTAYRRYPGHAEVGLRLGAPPAACPACLLGRPTTAGLQPS